MKTILVAILLATIAIAFTATAEPRSRTLQVMCGSLQEVEVTIEKYEEQLVVASLAPDKKSVNMLYVNFETQTSSWFIHDLETDQYCMAGIGDNLFIPKTSPLNIGLGTKVIYH